MCCSSLLKQTYDLKGTVSPPPILMESRVKVLHPQSVFLNKRRSWRLDSECEEVKWLHGARLWKLIYALLETELFTVVKTLAQTHYITTLMNL